MAGLAGLAGVQRLMEQLKAPASAFGKAPLPADSGASLPKHEPHSMAIKPPWHIRHARMLIAAAGVLAAATVAYLSYQVWRMSNDPFDRIMKTRAVPPRAVHPVPVVATSVPAAPEPVIAAPADLRPAVPQASTRRASVTHTQREEAAPAAAAAIPVTDPVPRGCAPGVAALGLCESVATKAGK